MTSKFHFGVCALLAALLIAGATLVLAVGAECEGTANPDDSMTAAQQTLQMTQDTLGMSEEEFTAYVEQMEQKYGAEAVSALKLHSSGANQDTSPKPNTTPNLQYISAWNGTLEVKNDDDVVLASSDNALVLYALDLTDERGRDHYWWWQWNAAQNHEDTWMGDDSNLRDIWSRVQFENATSNLLSYSPDSDIHGTKHSGADCRSISRDFVLHQGEIRPKPGECRVGSAGKFAVDWIGNYEGIQSIYGICEEMRQNDTGSAVLWTYSLTASQF